MEIFTRLLNSTCGFYRKLCSITIGIILISNFSGYGLPSANLTVCPTIGGILSPAKTVGCIGTASGTITLTGETGAVLRWELSTNAGNNWAAIPNTSNATSYNYLNLTKTTLYRAVVQSAGCGIVYSAVSIIVADPPYTPKIVATPAITCIGQPVTLTATGYESLGTLTGGAFDQANPAGWNGASANNNNEDPNSAWGLTNGDKTFNGVKYNSTSKFMIATGVPPTIKDQPAGTTYLTTPSFSTVGLTDFTLTWRQAYNLNAGAVAKVEISVDGGATYNTLKTYTGPDNLGPTMGLTDASINLDAYLGQSNVKVRFNYTGSPKSNWAIDDVNMTQTYWPLNYTWSPEPGLSSTSGATVTYTPPVSGEINLSVHTTTSSNCSGAGSGTIKVTVNPSPTLGGVSIPPICITSNLVVVNLSGLIVNTTSTLTYQIGNGTQTTLTGVKADALGNALFSAPATFSDNGKLLTITGITSRTTGNSVSCTLIPTSNNSSPIVIIKDYVWTGDGVGNLWTTVGNWNVCGVPPDGSSVIIPDVSPKHFPKLNVDFFTSNHFDLLGNATIDLNGLTLELGLTTASVINTQGKIIGSRSSNLTIQGSCAEIKFDQRVIGSTNALLNFKVNSSGQIIRLGNPLWIVGNVFPAAGIIASDGNLTMVSTQTTSSNITAFSLPNDVTGDVNVQSYITGGGAGLVNRGFRSMSSPINDAKITAVGAKKTFRQMKDDIIITGPNGVAKGFDRGGEAQPYAETITLYNESAPAFAPSSPSIASIDQAQIPGTGFLAFFRGSQGGSYPNNYTKLNAPFVTPDPVTITYSGPINKFDLPAISLSYTDNPGDSYNGYNLVGNPYPSSIDWTKVGRSANVINSFIIVLPGGKQASYLNGVGNNIPNSSTIIQPCQGFYVRASSSGATLNFSESNKSISYPSRLLTTPQSVIMSDSPLAFGGTDEISDAARVIRLNLEDDTNSEETTLIFNAGGSMEAGFEDALYFTGGNLTLASLSSDDKRMAINGLPDISEVSEIKLNINSTKSGSVKLKFTDLSQAKGYEVYLKDSLMGRLISVKKEPEYEFAIDKSKPETYGNFRLSVILKKEEIFPLALQNFTAKKQNDHVILSWVIEATGISKEFQIEQSPDGLTFHMIGSVRSQGNKNGNERYSFIDKDPMPGINYYRVRQIHLNGRASLSEMKAVESLVMGLNSLLVYPNPVLDEFEAKIKESLNEPVVLSVFDVHGTKVLTINFSETELWRYNISKLKPSMYILEVKSSRTDKLLGKTKFLKGT